MNRKVQAYGLRLIASGLLFCSVVMFLGTLGESANAQNGPNTPIAVSVGDCIDSTTGQSVPKIPAPNNDCSKSTDCYVNSPCPKNGFQNTTVPIKIGGCTLPKVNGCSYCPAPTMPGQKINILCGYFQTWSLANCKGTVTNKVPMNSNGTNECN